MEQLNVQSRSHASGGSWSARMDMYRMTLPWHTIMSYSCLCSPCVPRLKMDRNADSMRAPSTSTVRAEKAWPGMACDGRPSSRRFSGSSSTARLGSSGARTSRVSRARCIVETRTRIGASGDAPASRSARRAPVASAWARPRGVRTRSSSSLLASSYCPWRMRMMWRVGAPRRALSSKPSQSLSQCGYGCTGRNSGRSSTGGGPSQSARRPNTAPPATAPPSHAPRRKTPFMPLKDRLSTAI
mmetsp:Transcript_18078/g.64297  ORF Transcript_18078/g.64297 Transcript_18078/m.64297 type:complete len:242 (-) Transcript_18078:10-735(-)